MEKKEENTYVYEIVEQVGLGVAESPSEEFHLGLIYFDRDKAMAEADRLWKENTTEEDRNSGWCALYYPVKKILIIK